MSLLGKYNKQPVEVEIYSIQFAQDLSETDEVTAAWQLIARSTAKSWDQVVQTATYTALESDDGRVVVTTSDVTLPTVTDGYRLYVANKSQSAAISVGAFTVAARGAIVVQKIGGVWAVEAKTNAVVVDAPGDQRVRTTVSGGTVGQSYKVQVAIDTAEGRTLQDEFVVRIKEV